MTDNGWDASAAAWIAALGPRGDFTREYIVDPVMRQRLARGGFRRALDVGCGEGRFCRLMREYAISPVGIDPTLALLGEARRRDPTGDYVEGRAEALPFEGASFDLVVSYMTLIDIDGLAAAIREMARVLSPGGSLLIASLTSFSTAGPPGWERDGDGKAIRCHPIDHYLDERAEWVGWSDIKIRNWHRPLSTYMRLLLDAGLRLTFFDEPAAIGPTAEHIAHSRRRPWALVMEWRKA